jgi:uncharacterized protein (TIGR03437 family)
MRKILAFALFCAASLFAGSAETIYFRAVLLPSNEVPAVNINAKGAATLRAHVVRDDSGQITDGSVDFLVDYSFPAAVNVTGLHIHPGAAGTNGPVTISSGLSNNNPISNTTAGSINLQGQVAATDAPLLATLRGMMDHPDQYYANLHTTDNPGGVMRGQLQRANVVVYMGLMAPANEIPAVPMAAAGVSSAYIIYTQDASGAFTSGQMIFDINYAFGGPVTFTGFHIHSGGADVNGPVIFNTGIGAGAASVASDPSGVGNLRRTFELDLTNAAVAQALPGLLVNPSGYYINIHTTEFPGGVMRSQMRSTDRMVFNVTMAPANEVPAVTGIDATAPSDVVIRTVRGPDGSIVAGVTEFDVNCRFPAQNEFTGLHIHNGAASVNGPVIISSGLSGAASVKTDTGFGNIYRTVTVSDDAGLATLNGLVSKPQNYYVNIHTPANPGGVARSQLAPANDALPVITSVVSSTLDPKSTVYAPGSLVTLFGTNLAKTTTDLSGWRGTAIPDLLNGVAVAVDSQRARLLYVSPTQLNVELAMETPLGAQQIAVNNGSSVSAAVPITIASTAPELFFTPAGGLIVKEDLSVVSPANPAHAGDGVGIVAAGLGQTTPALPTGGIAPFTPFANSAPVTVTIGGVNATVIASVAAPGYTGLYLIAVQVPAGTPAGDLPVIVKVGQATSNTVTISVR